MTPTIEFYFDFGSPNAYLAYRVIPAMEERLKTKVELKPALLGGIFKATGNQSPAVTLAGVPAKAAYEQLETRRFVARHRLTRYRFNPAFPINTLQMMRGAVLAKRLGVFEPYVEAVYVAMWEDALNMGDPAVFMGVLDAAGLPSDAFASHIGDADIKQALVTSTEEAVARGVFGSPSFFVGDQLFFGKDRLRDVEDDYLRQVGA
jgi:2-hydroxychromene-2-carboxylate isomerase